MSRLIDEADAEAGLPSRRGVAGQATATTPLLDAADNHSTYSSSESSLTSWSSEDSGDNFIPWYIRTSIGIGTDSVVAQIPASSSTPSGNTAKDQPMSPSAAVLKVALVLIIGSFTVNADGSLVLATHPTIASEFKALSASNWLFVSFSLAGAATQAICGKLSDIYGRRALLVTAYALFGAGCILVGAGTSMSLVILGRVISGVGGSGLTILAMLIITDMVPLREAAAWQSYLNLASTTGRSLGGPLGGWLADTIGWRWSFLSQVPIFLLAIVLTYFFFPGNKTHCDEHPSAKGRTALSRLDVPGAILLALTVIAFVLPFEIGGSQVPWSHPIIPSLFVATLVFGRLFTLVESRWATEPIFPLDLLRVPNAVLGYIISGAQCGAQLGLMFSVPLYFQVTERASNTVAGAYLFPAVAGNAIGAILAGVIIGRTGSYKTVLLVGTMTSAVSYVLLLLRWHGHTSVWEVLYIMPGGLGTGAVQTGIFVAIQAATDPAHKSAALGGVWLTLTVGAIVGMTAVSAATMQVMARTLTCTLQNRDMARTAIEKIVDLATSDIGYIDEADSGVSSAVVEAYVRGLSAGQIVSLAFSIVAITAAIFIREHKV